MIFFIQPFLYQQASHSDVYRSCPKCPTNWLFLVSIKNKISLNPDYERERWKLKMLCVGTFCNSVAGRPAVFCGAYLLHPAQLSLTAAPLPGAAGGAHQLHRLLRHLASQPAPTPPTFCHLFADDRTAANLGSGKPGWRRPSSMRGIIGPFQHLLLVQKIALLLNALKPLWPAGAEEARHAGVAILYAP